MAGKEVAEHAGGDPLAVLGGTALRAYLILLRAGRPLGVREVQRRLGVRSPSTAYHHLERLVSLGLAERVGDGYRAVRPRGLLALYVAVRGRLLPRSVGLAAFAAASAIAYSLLPGSDPAASAILAAIAVMAAVQCLDEARALKSLERAQAGKPSSTTPAR